MSTKCLLFKITSALLIAAMVSEDISFALDRYDATSRSTLAPTSIFAPLYGIRWDEANRKYEITEVPQGERGLIDMNKREAGESYLAALIGGFLKDLEVREALNLSPAAIDEYFKKFKAALIELRDSSINPAIAECFRGYGIEAMEYTGHGVELTLTETAGKEKRMRYELAGGELRVRDLDRIMDEADRTFIPKGDGFDPGYGDYATDILRRFTGELGRIEGASGTIHEMLIKASENGPADEPDGYRQYLGKSIAYDPIVDAFVKIVHGDEPLSDKNCSGDDFWRRPYLLLDDKSAVLVFKNGPNGTPYGSDVIGYRIDLSKPIAGQMTRAEEDTVSVLKKYFIEKDEFAGRYRAEERFYLAQRASHGHGDSLDFRSLSAGALYGLDLSFPGMRDEVKGIIDQIRGYGGDPLRGWGQNGQRTIPHGFMPRTRSRFQKVMIADEYELWRQEFGKIVKAVENLAGRVRTLSMEPDTKRKAIARSGLEALVRQLRSVKAFGDGSDMPDYGDGSTMSDFLLDALALNSEWLDHYIENESSSMSDTLEFIRDRVKSPLVGEMGMFAAELPDDPGFFSCLPRGQWKWLSFSIENAITGAIKATKEEAKRSGRDDLEKPKLVFSLEGDYLVVKVIDHGTGIPLHDLVKVSDADFTKRKETGQACMHRVVIDHGGTAVIDSLTEEERTSEEFARRAALGLRTEGGVTLTIRWPVKKTGDGSAVEKPKEEKRTDARKHRLPRRNARVLSLALYGVLAAVAGIGFYIFSPSIVDNDVSAFIISAGIFAAIMAVGFIAEIIERIPVTKTRERTWTKKRTVWSLSSLKKAADKLKAWRERMAREAEEKRRKEERDEKRPLEKEKKKGRKQVGQGKREARKEIARAAKAAADAEQQRLRDVADRSAGEKREAAAREHQRLLKRIEEDKAERRRQGQIAEARGEARKLKALIGKAEALAQRAAKAAKGKILGARAQVDSAAARMHSAGRAMIEGKRAKVAQLEKRLEAAAVRYKEMDARVREIMARCGEMERGITESVDEENAMAVFQMFDQMINEFLGKDLPPELIDHTKDLNVRIVYLVEALRLKQLFPAAIRSHYIDICHILYKKDYADDDESVIYHKYLAMLREARMMRERIRSGKALKEYDESVSAAFRQLKETLTAQGLADCLDKPELSGSEPLHFIGIFWKYAIPVLRYFKVPERVIAFLGGLEELVFSFAMMKGIVYLLDLAPPGFHIPFPLAVSFYLDLAIISSVISYAFHAASGELYFFEEGRIVPRKINWKGNKDKGLLFRIGIYGFLIRAVYSGLAVWLDPWAGFREGYGYIVPVIAAVSLHGFFDSVKAYSGKVPLLMIGSAGKEKRTGERSLSNRENMARIIFSADRGHEPTAGELRSMLDPEKARAMNEGRRFPGKGALAGAAGVSYSRVLQAANNIDPRRGMRGVGESFGYTMRTRGPERSLRKRANVISTIYERLNGHWPTDGEKKKFVKKRKFDTSGLTPAKLGRDVFENIDKYHGPRARFFRSINYDYRTLDLTKWGDFLQELYKDLNGRYPNKKQLSDFRKWRYRGKYLRVSDVSSKTLHWSKHFGNLSGVADRIGFWLGRYDGKWSLELKKNYCRFLFIEMFHKRPTEKELKRFMDPRNKKNMPFPAINNYINAFKDATASEAIGGARHIAESLGFDVEDDLSIWENFLKALFIDLNLRAPREGELEDFGKWKKRTRCLKARDLSGRVIRAATEHWGGLAGVSDILGFRIKMYSGKAAIKIWKNYCKELYKFIYKRGPPDPKELAIFMYMKKPETLEFPKLEDMPERLKKATEALGGVRVVARKLQFNYRGHLGGPNDRWEVYAAKLDQVMDDYDFADMWAYLTPAMTRALAKHNGLDAVKWRFFGEDPARAVRAARALFEKRKYDALVNLARECESRGKITGPLLEAWPVIDDLAEKADEGRRMIRNMGNLYGVAMDDPYPLEWQFAEFIIDNTLKDLPSAIRVYLYRPAEEYKISDVNAGDIFPWDQAERRLRCVIDHDFGAYVEELERLNGDPRNAGLMAAFYETLVGRIAGIRPSNAVMFLGSASGGTSIDDILKAFPLVYADIGRGEVAKKTIPAKAATAPPVIAPKDAARDTAGPAESAPARSVPDGFRPLTSEDKLVRSRTVLYHLTYGLGVYTGGHSSLSDAEREIQVEFTEKGNKKSRRFHAASLRSLFILEDEGKLAEVKRALQGKSPDERAAYAGLAAKSEETLERAKYRDLYIPDAVSEIFLEASKRRDEGMDRDFADKLKICIAYVERALEGMEKGTHKLETMTKMDQLMVFEILGLGSSSVTPGKARKLLREKIQEAAKRLERVLDNKGRISAQTVINIIKNQSDKKKQWPYVAAMIDNGNEQDYVEKLILEAVPHAERVIAYEIALLKKEGVGGSIRDLDPRPIGEIPDISGKAENPAKGKRQRRVRPGKGIITGETLLSIALPVVAVLAVPALIILAVVYRERALGWLRNIIKFRIADDVSGDISSVVPGATSAEKRLWSDFARELARSKYDASLILEGCYKSLEEGKDQSQRERAIKIGAMRQAYKALGISLAGAGFDPRKVFMRTRHLNNVKLNCLERIEMVSLGKELAEKGIDPSGYFIDALMQAGHVKPELRLPAIRAIKGLYEEYYSAPYHVKPENDTVVDTRVSGYVRYDEYVRIFRAEITVAGNKKTSLGGEFAGSAARAWRAMNAIVAGEVEEDINIMLTYKCPFNCAHCLAKEICGSAQAKDTPLEDLYSLFDQLEGFNRAHLCGAGEPLCYGKRNLMEPGVSREFLELVKYAASKVKELRIVTSAYLVPEDIDEARKFFAQFPSNVVWLVSADYEHEEMYDLVYPRGEEKDSKLVRIIRTMEKLSADEHRIKTAYNIRLKEKNNDAIREIVAHFGLEKKYARKKDVFIDKILAQGNAVLNYPSAEKLDMDDIARHNHDHRAFFPFIDPKGYFLPSNHVAYMSDEERSELQEKLGGIGYPQVIGNVRDRSLAELVIEELLLKRFNIDLKRDLLHKRTGPGIGGRSRRKEWGIHYENDCIPAHKIIVKALAWYVLGREDAARTYLKAVCGGKSKDIRWDIIDILYYLYIKCPELDAGKLIESVLDSEFFEPFKEKNGISLLEAFRLLGKDIEERRAIEWTSELNFSSVWNGFPREWIRPDPRSTNHDPRTTNVSIPCPVYPVHPIKGVHPHMYKRDEEFYLNGLTMGFILDELGSPGEGAARFNETMTGESSFYPNIYGILHDQESGKYYGIREDTYGCDRLYRAAINGVCSLRQYEGEKHSALSVRAGNLGEFAARLDKAGLRPETRKGIDLSSKFRIRNDYPWFVDVRDALSSDPSLKLSRDVLLNMFIRFARTAPVQPFPDNAIRIIKRAYRKGYKHEMAKGQAVKPTRSVGSDGSGREAQTRQELAALGIDVDRETAVAGAFWDSMAGMACDLRERSNKTGQKEGKIILALDETWIKNDNAPYSQLKVVEHALKLLKRKGYENIILKTGEGDSLAMDVVDLAGRENIPSENIIVICDKEWVGAKEKKKQAFLRHLKSISGGKPYIFAVNNEDTDYSKGARIAEMFMLAMKLRSGVPPSSLDQKYIKINDMIPEENIFLFTPTEPLDIDKFARLSRVQEKALDTKA